MKVSCMTDADNDGLEMSVLERYQQMLRWLMVIVMIHLQPHSWFLQKQ